MGAKLRLVVIPTLLLISLACLMPFKYVNGLKPSSSETSNGRQPRQFFPAIGLTRLQVPHHPYNILYKHNAYSPQSDQTGPFFGYFPNLFQGLMTTTTTTTEAPVILSCELEGTSTASCGSCVDVNEKEGKIQSSNYPQEYLDSSNCQYTISVQPPGKKIKLKFVDFVLEDCGNSPCDTLSVFDGSSSSSSLGVLTGHTNPPDIISTSNKMTIVFSSDQGNFGIPDANKPGRWKVTYTVA